MDADTAGEGIEVVAAFEHRDQTPRSVLICCFEHALGHPGIELCREVDCPEGVSLMCVKTG